MYWTTRSIRPNAYQKSKNPLNADGYFSRKQCLLNYDRVLGVDVVAIAEGPFDVMAHKHAVGLMGKIASHEQIGLICSLAEFGTREFVVSLDSDTTEYAERIYRALSGRVPLVTVLELDHGDPDDRRDELPRLMRSRAPMTLLSRVRGRLRK